MNGLSIIIPVYNEENAIEETIDSIINILNNANFDYEVILVNDGSTDKSMSRIQTKLKDIENFFVFDHKINRGYGASLKTGINNSKYNTIAITDADNTYPNEKIIEFYDMAMNQKLDMLVGARIGQNVKIPVIRRPAKKILQVLANYLANYKIPDLNSGLRIMKKSIVKKFYKILPDGFSFTTTITLAMITNNYQVSFEKINYYSRTGNSKIRPIYDTLNFVQLIVRTVLLFNPLKIFLPVSLFMFLISFILIIYRIFIAESFGVISIILFVGAIQVLAIGMLADLIDRRIE